MTKITAQTEMTARPAWNDEHPAVDKSDTTQSANGTTKRTGHGLALGDVYSLHGRLTLESGVPVSTSDQTAKTTVYYTPTVGDCIALADAGGVFRNFSFSELSLSLAGYTADKNYDILVYNSSGTPTLESLVWTSDTVRATDLARTNGVLVKSGDNTRRYVGTIRITGTTGQCEDSEAKRFVWNYANRVPRRLYKSDATSHSYTTGTYRQWNAGADNEVAFVTGWQEDAIRMAIQGTNTGAALGRIGFKLDATNAVDYEFYTLSASSHALNCFGEYAAQLGYHYVAAIEYGVGSLTESSFILNGELDC